MNIMIIIIIYYVITKVITNISNNIINYIISNNLIHKCSKKLIIYNLKLILHILTISLID